MTSQECDLITGEINALRNDLIERGGIVDELKKIRELLECIYRNTRSLSNSAAAKKEPDLSQFLEKRIEEAVYGKKQTQEI